MKAAPQLKKSVLLIALALTASLQSAICFAEDPYDFASLRAKWNARTSSSGAPALAADDADVAMQSNPPGVGQGNGGAGVAPDYYTTMDKTAGRSYLWSDLPLGAAEKNITTSFSRLVALITRYKTSTDAIYNSAAAQADILSAIDWMITNHYRNNGVSYGNWWEWQIGTPTQLNSLVISWYGTLGANRISNIYSSLDHFMPSVKYQATSSGTLKYAYNADGSHVLNADGSWAYAREVGANLSNKAVIAMQRGVFGDNEQKILDAKAAVADIVENVSMVTDASTSEPTKLNDGFYADNSFIQHANTPYLGGYGAGLISDIVKLYYMFDANSHYTIVNDPSYGRPAEWALKSYAPQIYDGAGFDSQRGRNASRQFSPDHLAGRSTVMSLAELAYVLTPAQAAPLKSAIKGWVSRDTFFGDSYYTPYFTNEAKTTWNGVTKYQIQLAKGIVNDANVVTAAEPQEVRSFPIADRFIARGPGFACNVSMFSYNRISTAEVGNHENLKGWWNGAGATTLYNADHKQFGDNYWATIDKTRIAGTTTDHSMKTGAYADWTNWSNTKEVTGSVELNQQYGAAAMEFGMSNATGSSLTGKKAWFMFGDSVVAVGSGISGGTGAVETIVENRGLNAAGDNTLTVNDTAKSSVLGWTETMAATKWAHLAGNSAAGSDIGYVFPDLPDVTGLRESRTDNWQSINTAANTNTTTNYTRNFLSLGIGHGSNPANASYTYIVLPNATPASTKAFADDNPIKVLERSTDATAVEHMNLGVTGAVFWNRASKTVNRDGFNLLSSDKPAVVTLKQDGSQLDLAVSDPIMIAAAGNERSKTINLEFFHAATAVVSNDPEVTVNQLAPTVKIAVNTDRKDGKSIQASFTLAQSSANLSPTADAYVRDGTYANNNFGSASTMAVKTEVLNYDRNALMKFDLSGINGRIASATLRLTTATVGAATNMVHNMYQTTTSDWTEAGVTWANKPADGGLLASWNVPASNTTFDVDITSAAIGARNGNKMLSLQIEAAANYGSAGSVDYASKNNTNAAARPVLIVTYY